MDQNQALSAAARLIVAQRRKDFEGVCVPCGQRFTGYASKLYCGDSCKQAAYRERKRREERG